MLERARRELGADLARSFVIGDTASDLDLARTAGLRGAVLVLTGLGAETAKTTATGVPRAADLVAAAQWIEGADRREEPASGGPVRR